MNPQSSSGFFLSSMALILWASLQLTAPLPAHAQVEPEPISSDVPFARDTWHATLSPYLWTAGLDGDLSLSGHEAAVHQSFADIFSNLKFGVMGLMELRRARAGVLTDLLFVRVGDQKAVPVPQLPAPVQVKLTTTTFTLTPEIAYRVYADKVFSADLLAGVRYYHLGAESRFNFGPPGTFRYTGSNDWADALGGARLLVRFTPKVGAFLIGDAGGGGSSPTWQLAFGGGYKVTKKLTAQVGYRCLYFDRRDGSSFGLAATQQGLIFGSTMRLR